MTVTEIENYLATKNATLDIKIQDEIERFRIAAIEKSNEEQANFFWGLKQIFLVQRYFTSAFHNLQSKNYETAWLNLDKADIELGFLEENFDIGLDNDKFHLLFISQMIKRYQKFFPYRLFFSRESIIKKEKCSICNKTISLRDPCGHKPGKLYMGELCLREIVDMEWKKMCIVEDPFDKYSYLKIQEMEYNYEALEWLIGYLENPYDKFSFEIQQVKRPEYIKIGRNEMCPCGSGKKYKKCHWNTTGELMDHFIFTFYNNSKAKREPMRCINSIKMREGN